MDISSPRVDSLNVRDDSEIDWKLLPDEHWNSWSAHSLQRRWLTMKRSIKGFEEMSHAGPWPSAFHAHVNTHILTQHRDYGHPAHEESAVASASIPQEGKEVY